MAAAAASSSTFLLNTNINSHSRLQLGTLHDHSHCRSLLTRRNSLHRFATRRTNKDLVVRNVTPEVAGDVLSSFSLTDVPGFSMLGDNPWLAGFAALFVGVPLMIQRLVSLTKEVDMAAQTVEKIADAVGKVAEEVDKAAEEIVEKLPEGGLKKVVSFVEDLAEETAKDAQMVEDLMDKVEEIDDKLEAFLNKQSKDTGKA